MAMFIFAKAILDGTPIKLFNHGNMRRDFTYVDDVTEAIVRLIDVRRSIRRSGDRPDPASSAPWKIYNIGNNNPEELLHVVSLLEKEFGRTADKEMLPMQPGDVPATYADVEDLARDIGFRPATRIEDGIARFANGIVNTTRSDGDNEQAHHSTDHVRRRRDAAVAGFARSPSQAVPAVVRGALDVPGHADAGVGCGAVRAADHHHQQRLSLHGAGATGRDRPRGRRAAGADAARFRSCDRGRCGFRADARQGGDRAGAGGRSRGSRHGGLRRRLPRGARCRGSRPHRDLRRAARTSRHRIWLYQPRRGHLRPGSRGGEIRREAGSGDRRGLRQGRLSLEQRQLHVPCRRAAR